MKPNFTVLRIFAWILIVAGFVTFGLALVLVVLAFSNGNAPAESPLYVAGMALVGILLGAFGQFFLMVMQIEANTRMMQKPGKNSENHPNNKVC
jgi:drug/metabolite transporter (DMT)-like permease